MKLALERQIYLAFIFALILLLTLGYFGYRSANSLGEALKLDNHSQDVFSQLDASIELTLDAETSERGFVITGKEEFLDRYNLAAPNIAEQVGNLRRLVADNPQQSAELAGLENLIAEKLAFIKNTVELRRRQGLEAAVRQVESGTGKGIMDEIRLSIDRIKTEESRLLKLREDNLTNRIGDTLFILFFGTGAGIVSLGLANFAIFREVGKRARAEEKIREANRDLEKRVAERTGELSGKNEELEHQIKRREQAEERRRVALDVGGLGTWKLNVDGSDGEFDERTMAVFGLSKDEFDGSSKKAFSRVIEEDAPRVDEEFRKSVTEKINFDAEFRIRDSHGEIRWNSCTGQPQFDENGSVTHVVGFCRDITKNKKNELALRDSESFVRTILDSLPAHISVLDKIGVIVTVNRAWQNFARNNCAIEQVSATGIGQNYLKVCETSAAFEQSTKDVVENLQAILDGELTEFSVEYPSHSPTEERWFILQASAMKDGAVISHIDISARKRAEAELKNSEEFNRSIFENSPDCVKVLELDGTLHSVNSNGLCILEIDDLALFIGKSWIDFWEGDENEVAYQAVKTARNGRTANFEGFCKTTKGTLRYWDVSIAPIFGGDGKPVRLISTSRDITDRRRAEKERERLLENEKAARRDAEIANRMRDEFLATVSHELRAPLNSILGWGKLLQKGSLDEPTTEKAISTIVRNAESQNRLIEDLLDVSRIISGKLRLEVMTIKPINIVESALETVRPAADAKGIKIQISGETDVSHISGDPNRLQQVLWNLLSNAIKFTPPDGEVKLEIKRCGDFVEIRVKDSGIGLKEDFLPYVFDRFRQADASSIRKFGGLGLGLAIVRHITEMHGGTVHAESAGENQGSTFIVRLPLIAQSEENGNAANAGSKTQIIEPDPTLHLDGMLILVVDDEEDTRQLLVQSLTFYGATVITANSAENAFKAILDKKPDVMVSDIGMPDEDGYSLIRRVRALPDAQHNAIPAIALTAFTRAQDRMRALTSGYQNHVSKPVEPDELATVIASLTGRLQAADGE